MADPHIFNSRPSRASFSHNMVDDATILNPPDTQTALLGDDCISYCSQHFLHRIDVHIQHDTGSLKLWTICLGQAVTANFEFRMTNHWPPWHLLPRIVLYKDLISWKIRQCWQISRVLSNLSVQEFMPSRPRYLYKLVQFLILIYITSTSGCFHPQTVIVEPWLWTSLRDYRRNSKSNQQPSERWTPCMMLGDIADVQDCAHWKIQTILMILIVPKQRTLVIPAQTNWMVLKIPARPC